MFWILVFKISKKLGFLQNRKGGLYTDMQSTNLDDERMNS